jgi:hypothetical protein
MANDQGLATASRHHFNPLGPLGPSLLPEVSQLPNVVHLDADARAAELALVGEEAFQEFAPAVPDRREVVLEDCLRSPPQRDPAPGRHQRLLALTALDRRLPCRRSRN